VSYLHRITEGDLIYETCFRPYVFGSAYNASKAALHIYSDTMRIELEPFGVKIIEILTGGVKSNLTRVDRQLPANSYYLPINTEYLRRVHHAQEGATTNEDYAKSVVKKVLKKNPPSWAWEGNRSWTIWFVQRFLPWGFMVNLALIFKQTYGMLTEPAYQNRIFYSMFNLWKLRGTASKKID
jgi:1-acylglycerone phosphate reductase